MPFGEVFIEEGMRVVELETRFGELDGYEADSSAAVLLKGLGITFITAGLMALGFMSFSGISL